MAEGFDFASGRPGSAAIKASGRSFVCRYLGPARFGSKGLSLAEMTDYLNTGIAVVLNFESSGQNTTSYANGVADATYAQGQAALLGQPNAVIYFSNDKQDTTGLIDYLRGVASVIGLNRTGLYGGIGAIQLAQGSNAASWYWQTYAWSGGRVASGVHIYQYLNGQTINGSSVDFDRSLQPVFGQIGTDVAGGGAQPFPEDDMFTDADREALTHLRAAFDAVAPGQHGPLADEGAVGRILAAIEAIQGAPHPTRNDYGRVMDAGDLQQILTAIAALAQPLAPDAATQIKAIADGVADELAARIAKPAS